MPCRQAFAGLWRRAAIRDWLFVDDHCEAIHAILVKGRPGETYHIGGGNQPANLTIVKTICDILDEVRPGLAHHDLITFVPTAPAMTAAMPWTSPAPGMTWAGSRVTRSARAYSKPFTGILIIRAGSKPFSSSPITKPGSIKITPTGRGRI